MELNCENVMLNCRRCDKVGNTTSMEDIDLVQENGLCPDCVKKCYLCDKPFANYVNKLCFDCDQLCEDNRHELDEDSSQSSDLYNNKHNDSVEVEEIINNLSQINVESADIVAELLNEVITSVTEKLKHYNLLNRAYNRSCGNLGADADGGSINGEVGPSGLVIIANALKLNQNDFFCDFGSGGGKTATLLASTGSVKAAIGVENVVLRFNVAMNYNKYLLTIEKDVDVPITYLLEEIENFMDLNGITKLFMFDFAYSPSVLNKIIEILNLTITIQYIVSTKKNLVTYGFDGELLDNLGCLKSAGNAESHTFYLYKSNRFDDGCAVWNPVLKTAFDTAINRNARQAIAVDHMKAFHGAERSPRSSTVHRILKETTSNVKSCYALYQLLDPVKLNEEIVISDRPLKLTYVVI